MTKEELEKAIASTQKEIEAVKKKLTETTVPKEQRELTAKLKEMRYLQLWHLGQMEAHGENIN